MAIPFIALLPSIMTALGMGASHFSSRNAINRQNRYNDPMNQVARMNQAGLPMAALNGTAGAGNQSSLPETPDYAKAGGELGENIRNYISNSPQRKAMELIDEQINTQKALTKKAWAEALGAHTDAMDKTALYQDKMRLDVPDNAQLYDDGSGGRSNMMQDLVRDRQLKNLDIKAKTAQTWATNNEARLKGLDYEIKKELNDRGYITGETEQRIWNMILEGQEKVLQIENTRATGAGIKHDNRLKMHELDKSRVVEKLLRSMSENGMSAGEAFVHMLLTGGIQHR